MIILGLFPYAKVVKIKWFSEKEPLLSTPFTPLRLSFATQTLFTTWCLDLEGKAKHTLFSVSFDYSLACGKLLSRSDLKC